MFWQKYRWFSFPSFPSLSFFSFRFLLYLVIKFFFSFPFCSNSINGDGSFSLCPYRQQIGRENLNFSQSLSILRFILTVLSRLNKSAFDEQTVYFSKHIICKLMSIDMGCETHKETKPNRIHVNNGTLSYTIYRYVYIFIKRFFFSML